LYGNGIFNSFHLYRNGIFSGTSFFDGEEAEKLSSEMDGVGDRHNVRCHIGKPRLAPPLLPLQTGEPDERKPERARCWKCQGDSKRKSGRRLRKGRN
jgi:hypothetical protein